MYLLENLKWRYATKKYDTSKTVSEADLLKIKEAIRLSASSYGLQLFKVLDVRSAQIRERLKEASWGQTQITDASHLLVFCIYQDVKSEQIDSFVKLKAETQNVDVESLKGYADFMKEKIGQTTVENKQVWNAKQTYIALSNALSACAELKIDSTPMEGFDPEKYDQILKLKDQGLKSVVALAIGYRSLQDQSQFGKKVRKPMDSLFETL